MKKVLAILMALTVCGAVAYSVSAEDAESVEATTVVTEASAANSAAQVIGALTNDPNAQAIAEKIKDALATGQTSGDISALLGTLGQYVNGMGYDVSDLQDAGALNEVILGFLDDAGINSEELDKAIAGSTIAEKVLGIYYKPEAETTTTTATTATDPTPTTAPYSNPDTGAF